MQVIFWRLIWFLGSVYLLDQVEFIIYLNHNKISIAHLQSLVSNSDVFIFIKIAQNIHEFIRLLAFRWFL